MRLKKLGYIGLLVVLLIFIAIWGFEKVYGQVPLTGYIPSSDQYVPENEGNNPRPGSGLAPQSAFQGSAAPTPTQAAAESVAQVTPLPPAILSGGEVLLAVGDIATCSRENDEAVANIVQSSPGTVLLLGDSVYEHGSANEFATCFDPAWGPLKSRIKPSAGNHEYKTANASGYYEYFGAAAGDPSAGYYSFDVGTWHIIALNSNCENLPGGCAAGSPQETWLKSDLAAHPSNCTLAYWHHALFSSGEHGNHPEMKPIWADLYSAGVEIVLNGHDHDYERFAPQTSDGEADPAAGIRQFVVGTGGKSLRSVGSLEPNSEKDSASSYGLLKLTLAPDGYAWEFVPIAGETFTDAGQGTCH